jgi:hypothetical protein
MQLEQLAAQQFFETDRLVSCKLSLFQPPVPVLVALERQSNKPKHRSNYVAVGESMPVQLLRQHARWQSFGTRLSNKTRCCSTLLSLILLVVH